MGVVFIQPDKLAAANRWANQIKPRTRRKYAFAYIAWLRNGAEGQEPDQGRISHAIAGAIRAKIGTFELWMGAPS